MQQAPTYTPTDEAWGDSEPQTANDIALNPNFDERSFFRCRSQIETIQERSPNLAITTRRAYQTTLEHKDDGVPAENSTSEKSSSNNGDTVFPVDIFGFGPKESFFEVAHLIPNSVATVRSYWFVVPFLFNTHRAHTMMTITYE